MDMMVERLRAQKAERAEAEAEQDRECRRRTALKEDVERARADGQREGRTWAREIATLDQLERVAAIRDGLERGSVNAKKRWKKRVADGRFADLIGYGPEYFADWKSPWVDSYLTGFMVSATEAYREVVDQI